MATSAQPAGDNPRTLALFVREDFQALSELFVSATALGADLPEAASLKAAAERGLRLTDKLLAAMTADANA
jgi:hypothetical protein